MAAKPGSIWLNLHATAKKQTVTTHGLLVFDEPKALGSTSANGNNPAQKL